MLRHGCVLPNPQKLHRQSSSVDSLGVAAAPAKPASGAAREGLRMARLIDAAGWQAGNPNVWAPCATNGQIWERS
jgi:hypothetical protein